ncbi:MAG TPA: P-loop NTPase fold protein [Trebonia sp.]|nr:P-loop NTPase fold protein [Trebonia sp.]
MPETKKILLDAPRSASPASLWDPIARAFATIIQQSRPGFAIGIFGSWGSGKTTLMTAIKNSLPRAGIITVDFNAWRFQNEPVLLIPLLDSIRASILAQAEPTAGQSSQLSEVAHRLGRVVRALATGLSGSVGIPGAITVNYDAGLAIAAWQSIAADDPAKPQSLYVAAFEELRESFADLEATGISRTVVFVDDLDRCLPAQALSALESMKMFFDLPGFIFVVGLDEEIIDRALRAKFAGPGHEVPSAEDGRAESSAGRLGRDYSKRIFQVPYSMPVIHAEHLDNLLESIYAEAQLEQEQISDVRERVRRHLDLIVVHREVIPKKIKRFINGYILQTLIHPDLDRDALLALQVIAFRDDWEGAYNAINTRPDIFLAALRRYRDGDRAALQDVLPGLQLIPADLSIYLNSDLVDPLTQLESLDSYLSCMRSAH